MKFLTTTLTAVALTFTAGSAMAACDAGDSSAVPESVPEPVPALAPLLFFVLVITLFPLALGAYPQLLARIAPGVGSSGARSLPPASARQSASSAMRA